MKLNEYELIQKEMHKKIMDELETIYTEFSKERGDRNSQQSFEYRDGKCDGIDIALTRIGNLWKKRNVKVGCDD